MDVFTASDGVAIAYRDEGEGRALVLLHGLMANSAFFEPQRALVDGFRVISVDLRGHGRTAAGETPPTVARLAEDVAELARFLGLRDALAVGWSLGASVLWRLLSGPDTGLFAGAVVVDMTPCVQNDGDWTLGLSRDHCDARSAAIASDYPAFAATAGAAIFAKPLDDRTEPMARWSAAEFVRADAGAVAALWGSLVAEDFRAELGRIRQPTLVVHGAHSHLYDAATAGAAIFAQPLDDRTAPMARWSAAEFVRADAGAVASLWDSLVGEDFRGALGRIGQPTLVVHGAHSHLYDAATAAHIVAALPNGRDMQFDRSGHSPHLEQPERFNRALRDFAASLPPVHASELTF